MPPLSRSLSPRTPHSLSWRVGVFAATTMATLALCHLAVERAGWRFAQPAADETIQQLAVFRESGRRVDVALVGSSLMQRAITVPVFEKSLGEALGRPVTAYNFGLHAGTLPSYMVVVRDVLDGERQPDLIVLGLGARCLNSNTGRYDLTVRHILSPTDLVGPYGPRLTHPDELRAAMHLLFRAPATLLQRWREPDKVTLELVERSGSAFPPIAGGGPRGLDAQAALAFFGAQSLALRSQKVAQATARRSELARKDLYGDYQIAGPAIEALEELVALANKRGVGLLVLNLPVSRTFHSEAYQERDYETYIEAVHRECARGNVPFVDLAQPQWQVHESFFSDGDHLGRAGAHGLSVRVARELVAPLLAERR